MPKVGCVPPANGASAIEGDDLPAAGMEARRANATVPAEAAQQLARFHVPEFRRRFGERSSNQDGRNQILPQQVQPPLRALDRKHDRFPRVASQQPVAFQRKHGGGYVSIFSGIRGKRGDPVSVRRIPHGCNRRIPRRGRGQEY